MKVVDTDAHVRAFSGVHTMNDDTVNKRVREYVRRWRRARTAAKKRMWKAMIDNQVGYEMLGSDKDPVLIRKEWGIDFLPV